MQHGENAKGTPAPELFSLFLFCAFSSAPRVVFLPGLRRSAARIRSMRRFGIGLWLACAAVASAQTDPAALAARRWRESHERAILSEFMELLAMPNLARDEGDIRRN